MPDQSMTVLWLLAGGLVVVSAALGGLAVAFVQLRREMARRNGAVRKKTPRDPAEPSGAYPTDALTKDAIAAVLREEWAAFQALYRADLARMLTETRSGDAPNAMPQSQAGLDRLDHAIALARAGHDADVIMRECELDLADAEALVRFHGPDRPAGASSQL